MSGLREWILELYFYSKNDHNLGVNDRTGKKFTLDLKTTYKKVFLKYQAHPCVPSMCLAPRYVIFVGGRRRNKKKKKVCKSIGDPVGGQDASINWPPLFHRWPCPKKTKMGFRFTVTIYWRQQNGASVHGGRARTNMQREICTRWSCTCCLQLPGYTVAGGMGDYKLFYAFKTLK